MKKNLHQIFKDIEQMEPPRELGGLILTRVEKLRSAQLRRKIFLSRLSLAGSFGAFIMAVWGYGRAFLSSDFWILSRLLLTDATEVVRNWNDFYFSLLETFPVVSAVAIFIPIIAILFSFSAYFKSTYDNNYNLRLN